MEKQIQMFCQTHSINAYQGKSTLAPHDVLAFAKDTHQKHIQAGKAAGLNGHYNNNGNFSVPLINYYMQQHQTDIGYLRSVQNETYTPANPAMQDQLKTAQQQVGNDTYQNTDTGILRGSTKQQVLNRIDQHDRFLLHYTTYPRGGISYGHAVCVKQHNGTWYLLDSEKAHPIKLDEQPNGKGWDNLYGAIYVITPGPPNIAGLDILEPRSPGSPMHIQDTQAENQDQPTAAKRTIPPPQQPKPKRNTRTPNTTEEEWPKPTAVQQPAKPLAPKKRKHETVTTGPMDQYIPAALVQEQSQPPNSPPPKTTPQQQPPANKRTWVQTVMGQKTKQARTHLADRRPPPNQPMQRGKQAPPPMSHKITVATLNCRGIKSSWPAIQSMLNTTKPDILILTETKLVSCMHGMLKQVQQEAGDYQMHHSSIHHPKGQKQMTPGAAGVITLISNKYAAAYTKVEVTPTVAGYISHIKLGAENTTLTHIIGTYMPSDKPSAKQAAYKYIEEITRQCNGTSHTMLVAGDWNATLYPGDRSAGNHNHTDQQHAQQCATLQLVNTAGPQREHTYHCYEHHTLQHSSRIDDIYVFSPPPGSSSTEQCIEVGAL
jgi:exonuclease III